MRTNLVTAAKNWMVRPADQRFWTLSELLTRTKQYAEESKVKTLSLSNCTIEAESDGDLSLIGPERKGKAQFQHYSFGQFANLCEAPASYLRSLPAPLAAQCLNNGLAKIEGNSTVLFHQNGGLHVRCITSDRYQRIWNYEIAQLATYLEQDGWMTPPARPCGLPGVPTRLATDADVLHKSAHKSLGIRVGDPISPAGLYASDHDCFIFQVNEDKAIDGGDGEQLYRGVFWSNSEVGQAKFKATMFLYETCCGNHIVWGAKTIGEISIRHTGQARAMFSDAMREIEVRSNRAASEDTNRILAAKQKMLGDTKEKVIEYVYGRKLGLSQTECENAYVLAERHEQDHGRNPRSAWGFASGLTRLSQQNYADKRDSMDRAAGKLLEVAF